MLAGDLPYADVATNTALAGIRQGVDLRIVMAGSNHIGELSWAARPNSGINSIKDLAGKKVAFTNPKSTTEMVIRNAIENAGLDRQDRNAADRRARARAHRAGAKARSMPRRSSIRAQPGTREIQGIVSGLRRISEIHLGRSAS